MKVLKILVLTLFFGILASCSPVKVVTDMDQTVDFSKYSTYSFLGWQANSDEILNDFDRKRIRDAFVKEFEARGMKYAEEGGDMDVSLFIVVDQKTTTTAYTNYYGGRYGGYYRYRGGWGYGHATTTYSESDYMQGTLVMDVFDGQSKKQVWQGVATSTVSENPDKREKTIPAKIGALMDKFPVPPQ
jgi:hypothetical protein